LGIFAQEAVRDIADGLALISRSRSIPDAALRAGNVAGADFAVRDGAEGLAGSIGRICEHSIAR
jgi:hypothetical protein